MTSDNPALRIAQHIVTMALVLLGWVVFRAQTLTGALTYLMAMFTPGAGALMSLTPRTLAAFVAGCLGATGLPGRGIRALGRGTRDGLGLVAAPALLVLCLLTLASGAFNPFIYFRF